LFTQRTPDVPVHPGQISFPGGRAQAEDRDIVDTALRETEEEIGVARDFIEPIGTVFQYPTGSGFMITPIVALVRPEIAFTLCAREVAQVIEAPLDFFLDLGNYTKTPVEWEGRKHFYWEIQWQSHRVWGATAGIIQDLASRVAKARSQ
jgi:8-oxo-dGTP pyrophosphatase MutT (NUDIX family)